ncbi:MAG: lipoate--protein ligase family protein [Gemmataceae bacterium]|nr:lipoate--protein ligase family protein [Gemmataceae bacterium]
MDRPLCRVLPMVVADGPTHMATDEVLLEMAGGWQSAVLRFYQWQPATLSLGYFQPAADRLTDRKLAALPWVRRPTGGAALVHDKELTYALALPPGSPWQVKESWLIRMHRIIVQAMERLLGRCGVRLVDSPRCLGDVLCFQKQTVGDVVCRGCKVVGSAQRRRQGALLQHGGILLGRSRHTPQLPGIDDLSGRSPLPVQEFAAAIIDRFQRDTGWTVEPLDWPEDSSARITQLVERRYRTAAWNFRR